MVSGADHLYQKFGKALLQDEILKALLALYTLCIENTRTKMDATGVISECTDCAISGEGTCCGQRTGYKCDRLLLLINLLLGKTLPVIVQGSGRCYFLTEQGCSLRARPVICVNFLCERLMQNIKHEKLISLQQIAGREMDTLFLIEEYLKKKELFRN